MPLNRGFSKSLNYRVAEISCNKVYRLGKAKGEALIDKFIIINNYLLQPITCNHCKEIRLELSLRPFEN